MSFGLTNKGSGAARDVIISYHASVPAELAPAAAIAADIQPAFKRLYERTDVGGILPLGEALQRIQEEAGPFDMRRLILVGFSEGVQGVRAQLREGAMPDAVVVVDGTHSATGFPPSFIDPWEPYVQAAKSGSGVFIASHSQIKTTGFENTHDTLQRITGLTLDQSGPVPDCARQQMGNLIVYSCDGSTAEDHKAEARVMLPKMVAEALSMAGSGGAIVPAGGASRPLPTWRRALRGGLAVLGAAAVVVGAYEVSR